MYINSPVSSFLINGREIHVKRDDLLHPEFSGNKARKLMYFLDNDFPHIDTLISYGGSQSNLMYSLSCLAKIKGWRFVYYTYKISATAIQQKEGNLALALANGMQIEVVEDNLNQLIANIDFNSHELLIHQGGADACAAYGVRQLADEINQWAKSMSFESVAVFLPSGTGVTALYLQKFLPLHTVYTTNCVGSADYLLQQWNDLDTDIVKPIIFENKSFPFAKPHSDLWNTIQLINAISGVKFDLVYDPVGWSVLLDNIESVKQPLLYLHCGGLLGNITMSQRYQYLFKKQA